MKKTNKIKVEREEIKKLKEDIFNKINELLAKGLNGQKYNLMINGEELKEELLDLFHSQQVTINKEKAIPDGVFGHNPSPTDIHNEVLPLTLQS
jgi:hypothetical protein